MFPLFMLQNRLHTYKYIPTNEPKNTKEQKEKFNLFTFLFG